MDYGWLATPAWRDLANSVRTIATNSKKIAEALEQEARIVDQPDSWIRVGKANYVVLENFENDIIEILFPGGDMDHSWDADTLELLGQRVHSHLKE